MSAPRRRDGSVSVTLLVAMPMLLLLVALAVYAAELARVNRAIQANADAAALAGATALVDDARLLDNLAVWPILLDRARTAAQLAADNNPLGHQGIELRVPTEDDPLGVGDIEFGHKLGPALPFQAIRVSSGPEGLNTINAVQVRARRTVQHGDPIYLLRGPFLSRIPTDAQARALAIIEQDIIGVRPTPGVAIPLAPIALLSDPKAENEKSWEFHTVLKNGLDEWSLDRTGPRPVATTEGDGDGLHEMPVVLSEENANAIVLALTAAGPERTAQQTLDGVSAADLVTLGKEIVLDENGQRPVPIIPLTQVPGALAEALAQLQQRGEPRIFPLYRQQDTNGQAIITGFVVARVLAVQHQDGELRFIVQPAMRSTPTAVTGSSRGRTAATNPYLARVRLVD